MTRKIKCEIDEHDMGCITVRIHRKTGKTEVMAFGNSPDIDDLLEDFAMSFKKIMEQELERMGGEDARGPEA